MWPGHTWGVDSQGPAEDAAFVLLDALSVLTDAETPGYDEGSLSTALRRLGDIGAVSVAVDLSGEQAQAHVDASDLMAGVLMVSDYWLDRLSEVSGVARERLIFEAREYITAEE